MGQNQSKLSILWSEQFCPKLVNYRLKTIIPPEYAM